MDPNEYKVQQQNVLQQIKKIEELNSNDVEVVFNEWIELSKHPFFSETHYFQPSKIYPECDEEDDEDYGNFKLDLYDPEYLKQAWQEKDEEGLGGKKSFLIGGINDASELVFINTSLSDGVAIMCREDVFATSNIDDDIEESISYHQCSIEKLILNCSNIDTEK